MAASTNCTPTPSGVEKKTVKNILTNFRRFLVEGKKTDYGKDGAMTLYHYADMGYVGQPDKLLIDPTKFGQSAYSRNEKQRSNFPRSFFYVNPSHRERNVAQGKTLYAYRSPAEGIYDLNTDPEGYNRMPSEESPNGLIDPDGPLRRLYEGDDEHSWGALFRQVSKNYDGMFYSLSNFDVVVLFNPVTALRVPREDQAELENQ